MRIKKNSPSTDLNQRELFFFKTTSPWSHLDATHTVNNVTYKSHAITPPPPLCSDKSFSLSAKYANQPCKELQ